MSTNLNYAEFVNDAVDSDVNDDVDVTQGSERGSNQIDDNRLNIMNIVLMLIYLFQAVAFFRFFR